MPTLSEPLDNSVLVLAPLHSLDNYLKSYLKDYQIVQVALVDTPNYPQPQVLVLLHLLKPTPYEAGEKPNYGGELDEKIDQAKFLLEMYGGKDSLYSLQKELIASLDHYRKEALDELSVGVIDAIVINRFYDNMQAKIESIGL